ncbi:antitoxin VapB family protein [Candidatus Woesearchaeota archaeon]|nr:antitoxin VapB family protein [Candidatus Woesearchaeota archaeon]
MAVKTITITEGAYAQLAAKKEAGESFSDVVQRLSGRTSLLELAGVLSEREAKETEAAIQKARKEMDLRVRAIGRQLK